MRPLQLIDQLLTIIYISVVKRHILLQQFEKSIHSITIDRDQTEYLSLSYRYIKIIQENSSLFLVGHLLHAQHFPDQQ